MIHPDTELRLIDFTVGYGVFATAMIPEGTITYVKDSLEIEITPRAFARHAPQMQATIEKYSYIDPRGIRIVSWDFAKYVNHCCRCNTMSTGYGFEIALREIQPGEQLTDEYGIFNMGEEMTLICSQEGCRRVVKASDLDERYQEWDDQIKHAMGSMFDVDQPLLGLLDSTTRRELDEWRENPEKYRSVYELRHLPPIPVRPPKTTRKTRVAPKR